jgi:hypothetical protein
MDPPIVHLENAVAALSQAAIVGGHHQRHALRGYNIEQELKNRRAGLFIERSGGLVRKQNLRPVHQRTAERRALAFSA